MSEPLHIVCPHCSTTNRVKSDQLASHPDCGQCHQPLFTGHPVALDDEAAFDKHITRRPIPVQVDVWAPGGGPCRMMATAYEKAAADMEPRVRVAKVNTEAAQALGGRYNIRSIPTLALFVGGKEVARQPGAMTNPAQIVQWVMAHLPR